MLTRHTTFAVFFVLLAACARPSEDPTVSAATVEQDSRRSTLLGPPAPQTGDFDPTEVDLPEPVATGAAPIQISERARNLKAETVELAVLDGMGAAAADIEVQVDQGIVRLSGEVASKADLQRAHYLARAVEGVIEVDHGGLHVRR